MPDPTIDYRADRPLVAADVARVFDASGIRRPTHDLERLERMFAHSNLVLSAWHGERLVGVARALTDFAYCCYLSDLAVDGAYQRHGIGRELLGRVRAAIGDESSLILLSAPEAMQYYPRIGFTPADNAFVIRRAR
jgi:GNAT superfamily N-acetyltransferase